MNNPTEKKEIDLLEYWRIILKRKWMIITFVTVLVVFVGVFSFTSTPLYRATASILIEEPSSSMLTIQDMLGSSYMQSDYLGTYFNTQLKLITSRSLAERVARKMNLAARPEFRGGSSGASIFQSLKDLVTLRWLFGSGEKAAAEESRPAPKADASVMYAGVILGGISVSPVPETRIVDVNYVSPHPALAAEIVNILIQEFIQYSVETRYEATQQASEFLTQQIAELREDLQAKEKQIQKYGNEKNLLFLNEKESSVVSRFSELSSAYTSAQIERVKKQTQYEELKGLNIDSMPQSVSNPLIQTLKTNYSQVKTEYDEKSKIMRANHPDLISLKTRLDSIKSELQSEIGKAVDAAESEFRAAQKQETSLQARLDSQKSEVQKMNSDAILYNSLNIEVQNKTRMLNELVAKQNETGVSARLGGLRTSNIKIIDPALVPGGPFSPNTRRNLMMALLLGLFGGLAMAFFIEYLDNTVKSPEDVEKITGLASLGVIPFLSPEGMKKNYSRYDYSPGYNQDGTGQGESLPEVSEIELINHLFPKLSISEDYRTVRTSILFSHADDVPKTICFTSAFPQEGKTATVANMAVSFAQLENRVLVIDCDMRKPRLHKVFKVRNLTGLSTFLTGKANFEDCVQKTSIHNIWMVSSGPHPPNPAELLNSRRMRELMAAVKNWFEVVLIDTPPVLAVIDPVIVSSLADCTIVVVRAGKTARKPLARAVEEIRKAKSEITGVIFNEVRIGRISGYSPYYHYYQYEYSGEALDSQLKSYRLEDAEKTKH